MRHSQPRVAAIRPGQPDIRCNQLNENDAKTFRFDHQYEVAGRSLLLFELPRTGKST
jgi:hypothetical protein